MTKIRLSNGDVAKVIDTKQYKALKSKKYNYLFIKSNGFFVRWGKSDTITTTTLNVKRLEYDLYHIWKNIWGGDIDILQFVSDLNTDGNNYITSVENIDWEIYDTNKKKVTTFSDFKKMFSKIPKSLYSIEFIIDNIENNIDIWKILKYTKKHDVLSTIVINSDITENQVDILVKLCDSVSVSIFDKEKTYNCVKKITDKGLKTCNLHVEISDETFDNTMQILKDIKIDERLTKLHSVIFMTQKEKGLVSKLHNISQEKFDEILKFSFDNEINVGFDSCSSSKVIDFINRNPKYSDMSSYVDSCNASIYSCYINAHGEYFPCSLSDSYDIWKRGISVLRCNDFMKDIWSNKRTGKFRNTVSTCRNCNEMCPLFKNK